mgnify:CR=1 FL=1
MLIPLLLLVSGYGFSMYDNTFVVTQFINGSYLVNIYYHYVYLNMTQILSGNVSIYYQPYQLTVLSNVPQLVAVKVASGNFSAIVWSGLSLTPVSVKVPAFINQTGTVTLYFLNGTSLAYVSLPIVQGVNETYKLSLDVYPIVSIGPITSSAPQRYDLTLPPLKGSPGFLTLNSTVVPALIGNGYAYLYGVNSTISGVVVEEFSPSLSVVYIDVPKLPKSVSTYSYDGIYFSLLANNTLLSNVKYTVSNKTSLGYVVSANGKYFIVFLDKVRPITSVTLVGNVTKVVTTPKGDYAVIVVEYTGNEPSLINVPLPANFVNLTASPPYALATYDVSPDYLRALVVGPANLTIYVYTPPSGFTLNLASLLLIVVFVLTGVVVALAVKLMRK